MLGGEIMVEKVEKRSGEIEPFIREKIVVSCLKSGAPLNVAREIADMVEASPVKTLTTRGIREQVLDELGKSDHTYRRAWIMYDKEQGRTAPT